MPVPRSSFGRQQWTIAPGMVSSISFFHLVMRWSGQITIARYLPPLPPCRRGRHACSCIATAGRKRLAAVVMNHAFHHVVVVVNREVIVYTCALVLYLGDGHRLSNRVTNRSCRCRTGIELTGRSSRCEQWYEEGMSLKQIGDLLGHDFRLVHKAFRRHGIPTRPPGHNCQGSSNPAWKGGRYTGQGRVHGLSIALIIPMRRIKGTCGASAHCGRDAWKVSASD